MRASLFVASLVLWTSLCSASRISVTGADDLEAAESAGRDHLGQHSVWALGEDGRLGAKELIRIWRTSGVDSPLNSKTEEGHDVLIAQERLEEGHVAQRQDAQPWDAQIRAILLSGEQPSRHLSNGHGHGQAIFASTAAVAALSSSSSLKMHAAIELITPTYAVVHVDSTAALLELSTHLPADTRLARLPHWSLPLVNHSSTTSTAAEPASKRMFHRPRYIPPLYALLFSPALDIDALRADARVLTGEDQDGQVLDTDNGEGALQHWNSRHSATWGSRTAAAWIKRRMQSDLAAIGATCEEWTYDEYFAPNVVCTIPPAKKRASDEGIVVFSSHLDSRGSFGSTLAPGGNDDGSGTTMLLALARHLGQHKIKFEREVRLVAFSGEEQGLVGSQHYAKHLHEQGAKIKLALQTDMIGYRKPGEPLQLAFPDKLSTQEATDYIMSVAKVYVPELTLGYTPACCSDHQSFWEQDFPATWVFERNGPIADDRYHNSGDVTDREGYDFRQIRAATRVVLASLLDVAGGVEWGW